MVFYCFQFLFFVPIFFFVKEKKGRMNQTELLNDLYYKQHNYDGIDILYKKAKAFDNSIKKEFVKDWLNKQQNKQLTTIKTSKKSFLPIYSETSYSFQIDLTFFPRYKKQNQQFYVLFTKELREEIFFFIILQVFFTKNESI